MSDSQLTRRCAASIRVMSLLEQESSLWVASLSIRRPVFVVVLIAAVIVLGIRALIGMKIELNPRVDFPFISILTLYPGAGPAEVESQVTRKIEDAVAGINGIKLIASSSQDEHSAVNIEFKAGTPSIPAASDVRERLAAIRADLPSTIKETTGLQF